MEKTAFHGKREIFSGQHTLFGKALKTRTATFSHCDAMMQAKTPGAINFVLADGGRGVNEFLSICKSKEIPISPLLEQQIRRLFTIERIPNLGVSTSTLNEKLQDLMSGKTTLEEHSQWLAGLKRTIDANCAYINPPNGREFTFEAGGKKYAMVCDVCDLVLYDSG